MAEPDNIVMEYLRHIRAAVDRLDSRMDDLTVRMGHVEKAVAEHSAQLAEVNIKLDRMDGRIARIESVSIWRMLDNHPGSNSFGA